MAEEKSEYIEKLIKVKRVSKAVKGGRTMSFSAIMVVGDGRGRIGLGYGKANDVAEAIRKSTEKAKTAMVLINLKKATIPHYIIGKYKSSSVLLKPAAPGTGIIAGGPVRAVMEAVGVHDILTKSQGSNNQINVIKATITGLSELMNPREVADSRGKKLVDFWG